MKTVFMFIQFILIVLAAVLLLTGVLPEPAGIVLSAVVLLAAAGAVVLASKAREAALSERIGKLSRELNVASSRITSVSQEIGVTIAENNDSSRALFEQTQDMRSLTGDVDSKIAGMLESLKSMISNAEEVRATALTMESAGNESFGTIQNSISEIMGIVEDMGKIKDASGKAAESMERLRLASENALAVIEQIGDISKQMHIIAVNASVEAVRAGSSGSSFSVVAREFQNLSAMTDSAVKAVGGSIEAIRTHILEVYDAVRDNDGRVDEGVRSSKAVEQNLNAIHRSFSDVLAMVGRIGGISETEALLAEEMGTNVDRIEKLLAETGENVARVYRSALSQRKGNENISEMGVRLKSASAELLAIAGAGAGEHTEALDQKTKADCAAFFPVIRDELCAHADIAEKDRETHHALLDRFKTRHPIVEAVWTNDPNGRFICSIPKAGIANAAMRDWFLAAVRGENFISSIYISGITKNKCVTLSMPFRDERGEIAGVAGVDLNLDILRQKPQKRRA